MGFGCLGILEVFRVSFGCFRVSLFRVYVAFRVFWAMEMELLC